VSALRLGILARLAFSIPTSHISVRRPIVVLRRHHAS
jgi:hypothetical protein